MRTMKRTGIICFISVGSNLGDPVLKCLQAMYRLSCVGGIECIRRSSLYHTEPVGDETQNWFVNAVVEVRTVLFPGEMLKVVQTIEKEMGRTRDVRGGPRIIDLDILLYGQTVIQERHLVIPHPEMHRRRFVIEPFCEIAPYVIHPAFGISIRGLRDRLEENKKVSRISFEEEGLCTTLYA